MLPITQGNPGKEHKTLFGKYSISKGNIFDYSVSLTIGSENNPLAIAILKRDDPGLFFRADLAVNNPNADVNVFKELYKDAKEHFRDRILKSHYLASTVILGSLQEKKLPPERIKEITRDISCTIDDYLTKIYGTIKDEEIIDSGAFGKISRGSKIWTPKEGLYVVLEAPLTDSYLHNINMQFNSDETHTEDEIIELRDKVAKLIEIKYELEGSVLKFDPKHEFLINLDPRFLLSGRNKGIETLLR